MDDLFLYRQIAEKIRQDILAGTLHPGDRLPPLRELAREWNCTIGTVQRAYQVLVQQGILTSRSGQGTHVAETPPEPAQNAAPLRQAALVNRAEAFMLEMLSAGYSLGDVDSALYQAMERWRTAQLNPPAQGLNPETLRFAGSHDPFLVRLTRLFAETAPGCTLSLAFSGSLGGLVALVKGEADVAGIHLWDEESDTYNLPFVRRFFPGMPVALLTLAHRRLGLMLPPGNPAGVQGLKDVNRQGMRLASRQPGSGTRVWMDAALARLGVHLNLLNCQVSEKNTHTEVARLVAEGKADLGIGVAFAAAEFGLDFIQLTRERYDLVIPAKIFDTLAVSRLVQVVHSPQAAALANAMPGYDLGEIGRLTWVG